MKYDFTAIEQKWQKRWAAEKTFATREGGAGEKFYALVEFPYPSGNGLHVGHARPYTAIDVLTRKRRMEGQNVLFPMGYDAFGLPTENYAIANHIHPRVVTERNVAGFRSQLQMLGYGFDWDREINTTDPEYYKWTQWIFLKLFEKGLAYKTSMPVNWCTSCKCVLANEEVVGGGCERCGSAVVRREKSQWMLKITEYAQRLIDDLDEADFIERVKAQQIHWIGRSVGAEIDFGTTAGEALRVFTTRPDTIFGATYMVLAPEHPYVQEWKSKLENWAQVEAYIAAAALKSDFERSELSKDKTGIELRGVRGINPANGKEIPIYISDYVLVTYGTGAIMAVPGHDTRDWEFARAFSIPIIEVIAGGDIEREAFTDCETGTLVNSDFLNGMSVEEAKAAMTAFLTEKGLGGEKVNYKLRDWVFSRQRYWGEPIPMVLCPSCGWVPLPEHELPLLLPDVESYEPTDNGESPLANMEEWVSCACPKCGGAARRETDTMPQWAGSSWYYLRYMSPDCKDALVDPDALKYWKQVDWYNGGMEHTTLHLLYSRFWHKVLYDFGLVPTREPYAKRTSHGMILGEGGEKMSKSRGNVVNPNDIVAEFGADTMRMYIMFIGDFEKAAQWSSQAVKGCKRFLDRVWALAERCGDSAEMTPANESLIHKTIRKVTEDIEAMKFNTAIAALMALVNEFYTNGVSRGDMRALVLMLSPFAPHLAEELWEKLGFAAEGMACLHPWPVYDAAKTVDSMVTIAVQVNGKMRTTVDLPADSEEVAVTEAALADPKVARATEGQQLVKVILVKNKLINLIFKA